MIFDNISCPVKMQYTQEEGLFQCKEIKASVCTAKRSAAALLPSFIQLQNVNDVMKCVTYFLFDQLHYVVLTYSFQDIEEELEQLREFNNVE